MPFFGFGAPAGAPGPEEQVISEEAALLQALRTVYSVDWLREAR